MGKSLADYGFAHRPKLSDGSGICYNGKDYSYASINGCRLHKSTFNKTDFQYAAITGSIFTECTFYETYLDNADLEFCNFSNCEFAKEKLTGVSFNNSDFIGTNFTNVSMKSVTLTGCLLDECLLDNVEISSSTLENACFKKCKLKNMDLRKLNMEFIEFIEPHMDNVTLPSSQVPYMFGCLEYLLKEPDNVFLSSKDNDKITIKEYLEEYLPLLKKHYEEEKEFFPLANIYMTESIVKNDGNAYTQALNAILNGIMQNNTQQDYRLLKFYMKLITDCKTISNKDRHKLYNAICMLNNDNESQSSAARNYRKHIAEIESYLFSNGHKVSTIKYITNIVIGHPELGEVLHKLYEMARFDNKDPIEITLSQNSPLCIEIKFFGDENKIESNIEQLVKLDSHFIQDNLKLLGNNNVTIPDVAKELFKRGIMLHLWEVNVGNKRRVYYNRAYDYYIKSYNLIGEKNG